MKTFLQCFQMQAQLGRKKNRSWAAMAALLNKSTREWITLYTLAFKLGRNPLPKEIAAAGLEKAKRWALSLVV